MKIVREAGQLREVVRGARLSGRRIGFVPTMGALHRGHMSLVDTARGQSDFSVVSIFVNPTQFGPDEDYEKYPRTPEEDYRMLESAGVDVAYLPPQTAMYSGASQITVDPGPNGSEFEGKVRPGHFRGVLTVVAKLFAQVQPDVAFLGQKDAQQLFLIRQMVRDLDIPVEIVSSPTIREKDGLAMSSRNRFLKVAEREQATVLFASLKAAVAKFEEGERSLALLQQVMANTLVAATDFTPDYATSVADATFREMDPVSEKPRFIVAGRLGSIRLIDNLSPAE